VPEKQDGVVLRVAVVVAAAAAEAVPVLLRAVLLGLRLPKALHLLDAVEIHHRRQRTVPRTSLPTTRHTTF
jgi:hypothetical protein